MPLSGGTSGAHDDAMHQGNAKRDVAGGLAALGLSGELFVPGSDLLLTRDGADIIYIKELSSGDNVFTAERVGAFNFHLFAVTGGAFTRIQSADMKDVANGIAALDAGGHVLAPGYRFIAARGAAEQITIRERTSDERVFRWIRIGADDYEARVTVGGVEKVVQHAGLKDVADGIAGLDADAVIPHERLRVGSFRAEHRRKVVSNDLRHSHDSEDPILSGAWAKYKTITMTNGISGTLRIKHTSYCENGGAGATHSRVYKNGAPLGADNANTTDTSYVEYSEDLNVGDLQPGDTLELWAKDAAYPDSRSVKNFRLYYVNEGTTVVASSNS